MAEIPQTQTESEEGSPLADNTTYSLTKAQIQPTAESIAPPAESTVEGPTVIRYKLQYLPENFALTPKVFWSIRSELNETVPVQRYYFGDLPRFQLPNVDMTGLSPEYSVMAVSKESDVGLVAKVFGWTNDPSPVEIEELDFEVQPGGYLERLNGKSKFIFSRDDYIEITGELTEVGQRVEFELFLATGSPQEGAEVPPEIEVNEKYIRDPYILSDCQMGTWLCARRVNISKGQDRNNPGTIFFDNKEDSSGKPYKIEQRLAQDLKEGRNYQLLVEFVNADESSTKAVTPIDVKFKFDDQLVLTQTTVGGVDLTFLATDDHKKFTIEMNQGIGVQIVGTITLVDIPLIFDTFEDTNGTLIQNHSPVTAPLGSAWARGNFNTTVLDNNAMVINSNQMTWTSAGQIASIDSGLSKGLIVSSIWTTGTDSRFVLLLRVQDGENNIGVRVRKPENKIDIVKWSSGSLTTLATADYTYNESSYIISGSIDEDNLIKAFVNGEEQLSATDSAFDSSTEQGIGLFTTTTFDLSVDDFSVDALE